MNPDWNNFLAQHATEFADSPQLPDCCLFDLSHLGLLRIEGDDALEFMQGQFTNDSRQLGNSRSQLSATCTPKGRMLGLFRIVGHEGGWLLQLPPAVSATLHKRLQMFVLRSKVQISEVSDQLVQIGLAGNPAEKLLDKILGGIPEKADDQRVSDGICCVRFGGALPRFLLLASPERAMRLWQQLSGEARPCASNGWKLLAIRAGEPAVYPQTAEAFVPQMLNLQLVNGLSFTKGCYTGQEVVARMQYLGKLKRRMYRARLATATVPQPGDELFSSTSSSGQGAGRIVETARAGERDWEVLAVIESSLADEAVHLGSNDGPQLELLELPYSFPENQE